MASKVTFFYRMKFQFTCNDRKRKGKMFEKYWHRRPLWKYRDEKVDPRLRELHTLTQTCEEKLLGSMYPAVAYTSSESIMPFQPISAMTSSFTGVVNRTCRRRGRATQHARIKRGSSS